jgi:CubicO group peptidase (beta-lactamase class C family)
MKKLNYKKFFILFICLFSVIFTSCSNIKKVNTDAFSLIDTIINNDVKNGFPGGQLVIWQNGKIIKNTNYGYTSNYNPNGTPFLQSDKQKVNNDTLYDLASNTKMYATNYALQKLVYENKLDINKKIQDYFPDFKDLETDKIKGKNTLTVQMLLHHVGGFPADPKYFDKNYIDDSTYTDANTKVNLYYSQNKSKTLEQIKKTPLIYTPGTQNLYSDVDYMLLGFLVEKISGMSLDKYVADNFYKPLGLSHITYSPLKNGFTKSDCAATELNGNSRDGKIDSFENIRKGVIQCEVHDEKAYYSMNEISGHAGLFSNATDLTKLASLMLTGGKANGKTFFDQKTIDLFTEPNTLSDTYGLGWRRQGDAKDYSAIFSDLASTKSFGHTGWTGTLTLIDPETNTIIVYLTNRKNTPVVSTEAPFNEFAGDDFTAGWYEPIARLSYMALLNYSNSYIQTYLTGIINLTVASIESGDVVDNKYSRKAVKSLLETLDIQKNSAVIKNYKNSDAYNKAILYSK